MKKTKKQLAVTWSKRLIVYIAGLFLMAVGVAFSSKSSLGVSPVGSLANVIYMICLDKGITLLTLGNATMIVYCAYILCELIILRRDFKPVMLLQLVATFIFGQLVNLAQAILSVLPTPENYALRMGYLLLSIPLVALGVMLYLSPDILPTPGEGMSLAISKKTGKPVGSSKTIFDCSLVVVSCAVSFLYFRGLVGVREGTVICALLVGFVLRIFQRFFQKQISAFVERGTKLERAIQAAVGDYMLDANGNPKVIIAIGREFGAGGYEIGQKLSKKLGITFYDKQIDKEAAAISGLSEEYVASLEAHMEREIVYEFKNANYAMAREGLPPQERLYVAQSAVIRKIAASDESCVIMGHCADHVLYDDKNCFRIFIHAVPVARIDRIQNLYNLDTEEAKRQMENTDLARARHYKHFTGRNYGSQQYYHLAVDTSQMGTDGCVDIIIEAVRKWCDVRGTHPLSTLLDK